MVFPLAPPRVAVFAQSRNATPAVNLNSGFSSRGGGVPFFFIFFFFASDKVNPQLRRRFASTSTVMDEAQTNSLEKALPRDISLLFPRLRIQCVRSVCVLVCVFFGEGSGGFKKRKK